MCYKNTCERHRNGKEEAGYWPQPVTKDEDGAREINTPCLQTGMKGESWKTCIEDLCIAHRRYKEWNKEFPHIITGEQARELFPGCDFIGDCSDIPWQMCYEKPCMRHRHFKKAAGYWPKPISLNWERERLLPCATTGKTETDWRICIDDLCLAHRGFKERMEQFPGKGCILEEDMEESEEPLTQQEIKDLQSTARKEFNLKKSIIRKSDEILARQPSGEEYNQGMQAELSMGEKKLLIDRESEQAKAWKNAASKVAAWPESPKTENTDEDEEEIDENVDLEKIARETREQMDKVVTSCQTLATMLNRVEELAEVLEDQEPGCVVSAAEREINMSTPATLIQVKLKINDTLAWAMVDSGALENFISPAEARRLEMGITRKGKRDQYTLQTIDGSSASQGQVIQETIPTKVVLGAHFEWIAFDVL